MNKTSQTKQEVDKLLNEAEFKFAKTMPEIPHSYTRSKSYASYCKS